MITWGALFHDFNPIVVRLWGDWAVRWYGLSYIAGFVICWAMMLALARRRLIAIRPERVDVAMMAIVLGVLLGGRLGYALIYGRELLTGFTVSFPYWDLLAINKGGMASHGGMIGAIVACWWVSRGERTADGRVEGRCSVLHVMDVLALAAPVGLFLGRLANFVNGELLGRVYAPPGAPGPWWTVRFPQELKGWQQPPPAAPTGHAPELNAEQQRALVDLVEKVARPGDTWAAARDYVIEHAGRYRAELEPILSSRHPSQIYQAVAEGLVLGVVVWWVWRLPRKPGVVAGVWLAVYGVLRIVTEVWRLPDAQFGSEGRPLGLSRGQWLSVGLVAGGVMVAWWAWRSGARVVGGWLRPARVDDAGAGGGGAR